MRYSPIALLVACTLAAGASHAELNTIIFNGEVTDQTCKAEINGQAHAVLELPVVSAKDLNEGSKTAGLTQFTMNLTGCKVEADKDTGIKVKFQAFPVTEGKNLANIAPAHKANNVSVQLTENADGTIPVEMIANASTTTSAVFNLEKGKDTASHTFAAQYINDSGDKNAEAGAVKAVVGYTLSYL